MGTECGLRVLVVTLLCVTAVKCACNYKGKVTKAGPCSSNKDPVLELKNFDMEFSDNDCGISLKGCIELKKDVTSMEVKYKAYKDGLPVISGSKVACGFKEGELEVKCPLKKGTKICPGKSAIAIPGGAKSAGMAKGNLKAVVDIIADGKKYCYEGTGTVKDK
ncbi:hypothetical protein GE061_000156 [Apolygus lucorum]|uniref:MD-2-related lipid-recognition domain-containing protein n=1 Tax=Apolygus lucorum TaxID=248454 RepID=A0A6A4KJ10_APOLU|nr:hypothetical protein GE061_000156 [Apolygus lucorum]